MQRCLDLAQLGAGAVSPNPMVGAVLVYQGLIIGEGYHRSFGGPHAEVNCLLSVAEDRKELILLSTLYVSLEPCSHFGKTPPCSDLIIENKIPRVVIGSSDPNPEVNGKGILKLKQAGIQVITGVLEKESAGLNKRFICFHTKKRPYIILKWAQSADGKMAAANDKRLLISNELTNRLVHKWRSEVDAIMIGTNTALKDQPSLTTRLWPRKNPLRVVLDLNNRIPREGKLFDDSAMTLVIDERMKSNDGKADLPEVMRFLAGRKIQSVLVEGGPRLLNAFIETGLWDEARVITNEGLRVGDGLDSPKLLNADFSDSMTIGSDRIDIYYPQKPNSL